MPRPTKPISVGQATRGLLCHWWPATTSAGKLVHQCRKTPFRVLRAPPYIVSCATAGPSRGGHACPPVQNLAASRARRAVPLHRDGEEGDKFSAWGEHARSLVGAGHADHEVHHRGKIVLALRQWGSGDIPFLPF